MLEEGLVSDGVKLYDIDYGVIDLLWSVQHKPEKLKRGIMAYEPAPEHFYRLKEKPKLAAIEFLILNRISYGGMGAKAGSPIGGRSQTGWSGGVGCRWNPKRLCQDVDKTHSLLNSVPVLIEHCSWESVGLESSYIDPPYMIQGKALYPHGEINHALLATRLRETQNWVLSYDNCQPVLEMYQDWTQCTPYSFGATNANSKKGGQASKELLIVP
jgi:site-specific DNA-adenine methylase